MGSHPRLARLTSLPPLEHPALLIQPCSPGTSSSYNRTTRSPHRSTVVLPREVQVHADARPVTVRVLLGQGLTEAVAAQRQTRVSAELVPQRGISRWSGCR